ncbi:MAG: sulfatase-like hydrolase/transferase [Vicingaceae bacterium]|nr:sulfatase-like hydrolase/transferase [Vicingaceae bacterium]
MNNYIVYLKNLIKKLAIAFLLFTLCRFVFYFVYANNFSDVSFNLFIYGLRFDMVAISFLFTPLIFLQLLPFSFRSLKRYHKILNIFFYIAIVIGITLNMVDVGYFEYTLKRTTADLFGMISTGDDFFTLLPHYIIDFWYAYVFCAALIYIAVFLHKRFCKLVVTFKPYLKKDYFIHSAIFICFIGFLILGMRGGLQYKPLSIINAGQYAETQNIPLVLNTPFSIMKTLSADKVEAIEYFNENELVTIYTPEQEIKGSAQFKGKNVVLIILESFAKEYIGSLNNNKGYTPFLDSLINESYVYENAYANGQRSMESLPSILAGLPQLMGSSYIISNYASNELDGLPKILKQNGYNTSFYHGGANGTMGFNGFTKIIGIDSYYGLDEYPKNLKEKDYDGLWGIFDEPYLKYFSNELNNKKEPFFSTVFTLSSHHPYTIPKNHLYQFPKGNLDIHESIGYADYALKQFFEKSKKMQWFNNTIFVFTADHSSLSESAYYKNKLNRFAIPILIYDPTGNLKGKNKEYFQQIDITPTLLSLTIGDNSIIAFGNNSFQEKDKVVINYISNTYQMAFNEYFLIFDGEKTTNFYNTEKDSLLKDDLIDNLSQSESIIKNKYETRLKAIIQQYNNRIINNQLSKN